MKRISALVTIPIAKALLNAHKRGVKVEVILDKSLRTQKYSSATFLYNSGITTKIGAQQAIVHNKVMVIDEEIIIKGPSISRRQPRKTMLRIYL